MIDENGNETVLPLRTRPALTIRMHPEDAKKFTAVTEQAIGRRVLMMVGKRPLIAPQVNGPIATESLILTVNDTTDQKKVGDELKKLVR